MAFSGDHYRTAFAGVNRAGPALRLSDADIREVGRRLNRELDALRAELLCAQFDPDPNVKPWGALAAWLPAMKP